MKIKRFHAKSMREAMRLVREEQGPDAVILSNRRIPGGIEVVAAVDYDAALMQQSQRHPRPTPKVPAAVEAAGTESEAPASLRRMAAALAANDEPRPRSPAAAQAVSVPPPVAAVATAAVAAAGARRDVAVAPAVAAAQAQGIVQLQSDINVMRKMLEEQLASLMWGDMQRRRPRQAQALRALAELGLDPDLARSLAEEIPENTDAERARFLPLGLLGRRIPVSTADPVLDGGMIALVGPTGVGKTTTIAKLAARFAAQHGVRDIALVTMDHYRIGAQEQLFTYGRLLGVPVHAIGAQDSLTAVLERLSDRKLVLIDTAGMSQRDKTLAAQITRLRAIGPRLKSYLVLGGNVQVAAMDDAVRRFGVLPLTGLILSKLDEADRVGGALSVAIRRNLPITYYTDGQRVPEDLHPAKAERLVLRATQLARQTPAALDDSFLASGFTTAVNANANAQ